MDKLNNNLPISFLLYSEIPENAEYKNDSLDILVVLSGECTVSKSSTVGKYSQGGLVLINPNEKYSVSRDKDGFLICVGILGDFADENTRNLSSVICDSFLEPNRDYSEIVELITAMSTKYLEDKEKNRLTIMSCIYRLLAVLEKDFANNKKSIDIPQKYTDRMNRIAAYIESHIEDQISLSELAQELYITPQYLSRFFKNILHVNFKDYVAEQKLHYAKRELAYTDSAVTDIAVHIGYSGTAAFSKVFRAKFGVSPTEYRKLLSQSKENNTAALNQTNKPIISEKTNVLVSVQSHTLSVKNYQEKPNSFCRLINIGMASNLLSASFCECLKKAKDELGLEYIRIQGLTDDFFIPNLSDKLGFYFQNLDRAFGTLYELGLIPFIELSKLPSTSEDNTNSFSYRYLPRGKRFCEKLSAILKQITANYPAEWTEKIIFEFSKNPSEGLDVYINDFKKIRETVSKYLPNAKIGGYGLSSGFNPEVFSETLTKLHERKVQLDFISAHFSLQIFGYNKYVHISSDPSFLLEESKTAAEIIEKILPNTEFYLTEYSSMFVSDMPVGYSCYQSAFICKTALELRDYFSLMGYMLFSDTASANPFLGKKPNFWGHGLLDRNLQKHPSYHAFSLLHGLDGYVIKQGENYIVTRSDSEKYQILIFSYSHFKASNSFRNAQNTVFSDVYTLFESGKTQSFNFTLEGLSSGIYRITEHTLSRENGSMLDIWADGFKSGNISETQYLMKIMLPTSERADYYHNICVPKRRIFYREIKNEIELHEAIEPHSVCLWEIVKRN